MMTARKAGGKEPETKAVEKKCPTLKAAAPQLGEAAEYHRQKVEGILRRQDTVDSARELLGYDIVASTDEGIARVRITKTRSFSGLSKSTTNREGIEADAGHVYIMKHRVAKFLNVTTGREGRQTCVWIEEATDLSTGKTLKSNQLLRTLGLENSDGEPIFSARTAIVPGAEPSSIERLSPSAERASSNTTAVFRAHFGGSVADGLRSAMGEYSKDS